ncbi:DNA cytosine methyltransferase [Paenibacillus ehimensis]|uniref:DNA cytosine methyltransferase n=1 Tax=Paenibacillus ehimensis TaxID=79264 RepID=UPI000FD95024|nr:DNA cytosine methyltransferase [Paenibacillus ehimensis]
MKALSLFSGIGGIDLACEWAGIETVAFCEREPFCQRVLRKHWPNVPIYDDVCTLTKERLDADGIGTIDIVLSGDPCQPYSHSGERQGEEDDRFLWPEVDRLLETIRPRWVLRENVTGNITLGLDGVLTDLERHGYTWQSFVIPAAAVGAFHRRDRVFVVAHSGSFGMERCRTKQILGKSSLQIGQISKSFQENEGRFNTFESRLCRSLHGLPNGVDRVKALGNAVNPYQVYPILAAIKQIDDLLKDTGEGQ